MCTYLKNMEGYKLKDFNSKGFDSIQKMFDRSFQRVNTFEDFRTELVEGKEKRAGKELIQESLKKQKVDDDKETAELKQCLEIILDEEEVTINDIPLAVKSLRIVDWKIHKEGKKSYYQIIRADGKSQMYIVFSHMLKSFDREDLEDLYKLVKARYGSTRPVESMYYLLWNDMKIMFEPHVEDEIYMLVEKKYPLTPPTLSMMLEKKLQIDYESEMAYQLCELIMKQLKKIVGIKSLLDAVEITAAQVYVNTALMNKAFSCNALADLGASINLMPYSIYAKLSLKTLKPTKIRVRLADRSFQHPIRIAENMLVEVGKFTFPMDFIILELEEDNKVPLILGRHFLHTVDVILLLQEFDIEIKDKKGTENVAADHISRIDNDETSDDCDVDDNFPGETLMKITTNDTPCFADFANYLVGDVIPKGMTYQQKNKFFSDLKTTFGKILTFSKYV
ncbi:reverse transcriptase domain-containing protein [Tanacetum coccineum]